MQLGDRAMSSDSAAPNAQAKPSKTDEAKTPPNGPDYGPAPHYTQSGHAFGMPHFGAMPPPFGAMPYGFGYGGMPGYGASPFGMPGYGPPGYPGMDQMMGYAAFLQRLMITMSNMAAEISRACHLLAQSPSQIGMPYSAYGAGAPAAQGEGAHGGPASAADAPVDLQALKQALAGMDPVQAQKTLYAVQMMQWYAGMMRGGAPAGKPW